MSKKKKKKFKKSAPAVAKSAPSFNSMETTSSSLPASSPVKLKTTPASTAASTNTIYDVHAKEYRFIKGDLYRVLAVNGLFFIAVIVLYYMNRSNPFLQAWYEKLFG